MFANNLPLFLFVLLAWASGLQTPTTAAPLVFSACPTEVVQHFQSLFPEYSDPTNPAGRRRMQDTTIEEDVVALEAKYFKARFQHRFGGAKAQTANRGGGASFIPIDPSVALNYSFSDVASIELPNAGLNRRLARSGCTSCAKGCCNGADVILECARQDVPLDYSAPTGRKISLMTYRVRVISPLTSKAAQGAPDYRFCLSAFVLWNTPLRCTFLTTVVLD